MDIERTVQNALKSAYQTIKTFKPKLAISIYHSLEDFSKIVLRLDSLKLGYEIHVRHFTIQL
jgi:hypothetical protein